MVAPYDKYNYPSYWIGREYEHQSEVIALKELLAQIPKISKIIDLGSGHGRLTPNYIYRAKKVILVDPSARLLKLASEDLKEFKNIDYIQSKAENIRQKIRGGSADLILMIRVSHHLKDLDEVFLVIHKLLRRGGYFILEFPNKTHWKALLKNLLKGDFTFPIDIFPTNKIKNKTKIKKTLPFFNYHPDILIEKLERIGFEIKEKRSVSNVRNEFIKKHFPLNTLLNLEKILQKPLAKIAFGPSIFILARKT
jgi:SAM-dependent methyltransferase